MTKQATIRMTDELYDELSAYSNMQGSNLTSFCRNAIRQAFFNSMLSDKQEVDRLTRMLSEAERYELSNREKADLEAKIAILTAITKRFEETWADMAAELYGEGGENA